MARFGRVLTAMITPFDSSGALDLDEARRLARYLQDHGNDGLVVAGTTGEAPVLTDDERLSLFAAVIEAVTIPVIAGSGTNDTAHSVHLTREATALGAAGILALCPYTHQGHGRLHALAPDDLRHPGADGPEGRHGHLVAPVPRGAQHRRAEGRRGEPR